MRYDQSYRRNSRMSHICQLTCIVPLSSSQTTLNWIIRSGISITLKYSFNCGFFWNSVEPSRVDQSSARACSNSGSETLLAIVVLSSSSSRVVRKTDQEKQLWEHSFYIFLIYESLERYTLQNIKATGERAITVSGDCGR